MLTDRLHTLHRELLIRDALWQSLQNLEFQKRENEDILQSGRKIPKPYKQALTFFAVLLERTIEDLNPDLRSAAIGCQPFREYMTNLGPDADGQEGTRIIFRPGANDPLWFLVKLLLHRGRSEICGVPTLVDEIGRLISNDKRQHARMSVRLSVILSEYSILGELQRQLALSSPGGRIGIGVSPAVISDELKMRITPSRAVYETMHLGMDIGAFGLERSTFYNPVDKRRNATTTAQMRRAEQYLDSF